MHRVSELHFPPRDDRETEFAAFVDDLRIVAKLL
jgi:hypothetical protein